MEKTEIIKTIKDELTVMAECSVFHGQIESTTVITDSSIGRIADRLVINHNVLSNVSGILLSMNQCRETIKMLKSTNTAKDPIAIDLYYKVVDYMKSMKKEVSDYR